MRRTIWVPLSLFACLAALPAPGARAAETPEQAVRAAAKGLTKALGSKDLAKVTAFLAPSFAYKPFNGKSIARKAFVADLKKKFAQAEVYEELCPDPEVAIKGTVATLTNYFQEYCRPRQGDPSCMAGPRRQTWKKIGVKWLLVEDKETEKPAPPEAG